MSGTYDSLLRIKRYREEIAARAVHRAQMTVEQQTRVVQQAREGLEAFHEQRLQEERQRFEDIRGQPTELNAIETMNQWIARARDHEALLEQRLREEEKQLSAAREALDQARARHAASVRECEKFDQFVAIQRAAEEREQLMKEELELEEIAGQAVTMQQGWS